MSEQKAKPVYMRQRFLLNLIQQLNEGATTTDIQKIVFLWSQENKQNYYDKSFQQICVDVAPHSMCRRSASRRETARLPWG